MLKVLYKNECMYNINKDTMAPLNYSHLLISEINILFILPCEINWDWARVTLMERWPYWRGDINGEVIILVRWPRNGEVAILVRW